MFTVVIHEISFVIKEMEEIELYCHRLQYMVHDPRCNLLKLCFQLKQRKLLDSSSKDCQANKNDLVVLEKNQRIIFMTL